ncbi:hypothetical protein FQN57_000054 [Myotisia sp. PD_48]|nr:hypothetical protein FQN57_000054 [Myotisia sp. PD_48]
MRYTAIALSVIFTQLAIGLPFPSPALESPKLARRAVPYSVVPVDGGPETTTPDDVPMTVTVPISIPAPPRTPVTETVVYTRTVTDSRTTATTTAATERSTLTSPCPTSTSTSSKPTTTSVTTTAEPKSSLVTTASVSPSTTYSSSTAKPHTTFEQSPVPHPPVPAPTSKTYTTIGSSEPCSSDLMTPISSHTMPSYPLTKSFSAVFHKPSLVPRRMD